MLVTGGEGSCGGNYMCNYFHMYVITFLDISFRYILEMEPTGFADILDMGHKIKKKKRIKHDGGLCA